MAQLRDTENIGPYPCYFKCGRVIVDKFNRRDTDGWDWFTGYGEAPVHFCYQCRKHRLVEIEEIRRRLSERPEGYPDVRATP